MALIDTWITALLALFPHPYLLPFIGSIVGGEGVVFIVSALAAQGALPFFAVLFMSYLGTLLSDAVWFLFGKRGVHHIASKPSVQTRLERVATFARRVTGNRYLLTLIITKFLYGTRIITIVYMAREGVPFARFCAYNSVATGIWVTVVCTTGWLTGRGITWIGSAVSDITLALSLIAGGVLGVYLLRIWISKRVVDD